jgi:hypothetical protein
MTREEALDIWLPIISMGIKDMPEIKEAFDMAIKALEQEPCGDVISRDAVLDIDFHKLIHTTAKPAEMVRQKIEQLPSVNPQPKTGHWIIIDDCEKFIAKCSECGQIEDSRMIGKYAYCHCGAKMVEPQESEEV